MIAKDQHWLYCCSQPRNKISHIINLDQSNKPLSRSNGWYSLLHNIARIYEIWACSWLGGMRQLCPACYILHFYCLRRQLFHTLPGTISKNPHPSCAGCWDLKKQAVLWLKFIAASSLCERNTTIQLTITVARQHRIHTEISFWTSSCVLKKYSCQYLFPTESYEIIKEPIPAWPQKSPLPTTTGDSKTTSTTSLHSQRYH